MKLIEGFQLLASAPGGVARLRKLILSLAISGNLVEQDQHDAPASHLLQEVSAERERLIAEGNVKRGKPLPGIAEDEYLFQLPERWEWVRARDICTVITDGDHQAPPKAEAGVPFLVISDVRWGTLDVATASRFVPEAYFDALDWSKKPLVGDILYTTVGSFGIPVPITESMRFCFQRHIGLFRPAQAGLQPYLNLVLASDFVFQQASACATGIAQKTVPLSALRDFKIPLPPKEEQARIVAKVDELMRLCDELETRGRLEAEQHMRLTAALFDALAASESSHALAENWSRIAAHFNLLLDRPEAVDALEQTILQLAVRGLLVPQEPTDEPANVVLMEGEAKRDRLFAQGKISRRKTPSENRDEPEGTPRVGWEIVTFPDLCVIGGGATPSKSKRVYWDGKLPWVSPKDMKVEHISDAQDHVSELALEETRLPLVPEGSLLIVVRGMILAHSFPVGITHVEVTINQDMKSLTPLVPGLVPYLALVCRGFKREILELVDRSTHGTCKLQSDKLFAFRFGLPPLAEQARILARVEQMRHLCGNLRERLIACQTCQVRFAEALVGQAASTGRGQTEDLAAAA